MIFLYTLLWSMGSVFSFAPGKADVKQTSRCNRGAWISLSVVYLIKSWSLYAMCSPLSSSPKHFHPFFSTLVVSVFEMFSAYFDKFRFRDLDVMSKFRSIWKAIFILCCCFFVVKAVVLFSPLLFDSFSLYFIWFHKSFPPFTSLSNVRTGTYKFDNCI